MSTGTDGRDPAGPDEPVIRDKRRLDPVTGELRQPAEDLSAGAQTPAEGAPGGQHGDAQAGDDASASDGKAQQLADDRLEDLRRLTAEFANYRRRVDRDREVAAERTIGTVLEALLPVLDDIALARQHGGLEGPFKAVAEQLETVLERQGLVRYGEAGEEFDPTVHEALMHQHSTEVTTATCVQILQPGYRVKDRVLRPARVAVADPG